MDPIQEFCAAMAQNGCAPFSTADIKADDKRRNYRLIDDPPKKKRGYYKLKISGDFAFGFYGDWRGGECFSWHSKSENKYTKNELYILREAARIEAEKERERIKKLRQKKAEEAQNFLLFLDECQPDHLYIARKKIKHYGVLTESGRIIIPMQIDGIICNYQAILPDGKKLFLKDAIVSGASHVISGDKAKICVTEGFATGATVHEATGYETHVAFNAGNIEHVVKNLLKTHQKETILICADNDHETIMNGKPYNTGIEKAQKVLEKYGTNFVYPTFKEPKGKTDFNDLALSQGIDAVKLIIQGAVYASPPDSNAGREGLVTHSSPVSNAPSGIAPEIQYDDDFKNQLIQTSKGLDVRSTTNSFLITLNDPPLRGVYKYDSFSKQILITRAPPWEDESTFSVRPIADYDYLPLECYLETVWGLKTNKSKCADIIERVATLDKHTFNPASDYFNALEWDGVPRLSNWLSKYVTNGKQPSDYLSIVGTKFLCGLAARAMKPGCKFDTMLILEGVQYAGKSYLSRIMGTVGNAEYFLDDFRDIENKDAMMKMQGKLVVEFPEISTMRKAEVSDLKAFITRQTDEYRPPYGRNVKISPRQCVFIGTVNPEGPYFRDLTGNRRYWPVACRGKLNLDELKKIMPLLHAEAAHLVRNGHDLWLDDVQYEIAKLEQKKRVIHDLWTEIIEKHIQYLDSVSTDDLIQAVGIPMERRSPIVFTRISQVMAGFSWEECRVYEAGIRKRGYKRPDEQINKQKDLLEDEKEKDIAW